MRSTKFLTYRDYLLIEKYLLALHNIPIPLEIFPLTYFACSPHFKESSIMIPKNFVDFTCAICCPLIINDCVRLASFRCLRNNTKWVLSVFKVSLLALNQSMTFIISVFIVLTRSLGSSPDIERFESSANKILNKTLETFARSLMYKRKRSGPKIDPCGIPQVILLSSEFVPAYSTYCSLLFK